MLNMRCTKRLCNIVFVFEKTSEQKNFGPVQSKLNMHIPCNIIYRYDLNDVKTAITINFCVFRLFEISLFA